MPKAQKSKKAPVTGTSPTPSPTKLLEARLLLAKAEQSKAVSKEAAKAAKALSTETNGQEKKKRVVVVECVVSTQIVGLVGTNEMHVFYRWSKKEMFHITSSLLTLIEDNSTWIVALGFNKGDETSVPNGGKKLAGHYRDIAERLFFPGDGSGQWKKDDLDKLRDSVKNRIQTYC
jgi:hypothetical protein